MSADPPANFAAVSAPSNQPEPMMEPSETKVRPQNPTVRFKAGESPAPPDGPAAAGEEFDAVEVVMMPTFV
ncbi:hypothetical protein GCM10011399_07600 [Subtercola lobariae]|uniref:Uncharacterized protein n=1 Tax=Subtercola lobariae TaxID=1588641 RepID=A0A917B269_9MICO|nr:hypothetical protein GCM10011399_07600 [Subtercola lobariae]